MAAEAEPATGDVPVLRINFNKLNDGLLHEGRNKHNKFRGINFKLLLVYAGILAILSMVMLPVMGIASASAQTYSITGIRNNDLGVISGSSGFLLDRVITWADGTKEHVQIGNDGYFYLDGAKKHLVGINFSIILSWDTNGMAYWLPERVAVWE